MDKNKVLKWGGIAAVVAGTVALYISGAPEAQVVSIVGAIFVLAGIIATIVKT